MRLDVVIEDAHRQDLAAREAFERECADADDREVLQFLVEIAPEAERRHVADADDLVEVPAGEHALAGGDGERVVAEAGERLGVNGSLQFFDEAFGGFAIAFGEAGEDDEGGLAYVWRRLPAA